MKSLSLYVRRSLIFRAVSVFFICIGIFAFISNLTNYQTTELQKYNGARCPIPNWSKKLQVTPWYSLYLSHLQKVDLSSSPKASRDLNCARWWHPTPQWTYEFLPDRGLVWKSNTKLPNHKRPNCTFGQKLVPKTTCGTKMEPLWKKLDEIGVLYYPRDGSELGIVKGSSYLTTDGDMDIFVDMPQEMLFKALVNTLSPKPVLSGKSTWVGRGVHWQIKECPIVHIHFSDWTGVERGKQATHMDTCTCMLNSVPITCHREAIERMYTEYGPSWRVPLHSKHLDYPIDAYNYNTAKKLMCMVSSNGLIEEESVRALDRTIDYSAQEMNLILAHLNIIKAWIDDQTPVLSMIKRLFCNLGFHRPIKLHVFGVTVTDF